MSQWSFSEAAVGRIVAAVKKEPKCRSSLAALLAEAQLKYVSRRIPDLEHTASKQCRALTDIHIAVQKFFQSIQQYQAEGLPGWAWVESAADLHGKNLDERRQTLNTRLPTSDRSIGEALQHEIRQIDQALLRHERRPVEVLNQLIKGSEDLNSWLRLVHRHTRDGKLISSQRAEKGEGHITARRWLIVDAIPEIYQSAFSKTPVGKRATHDPLTSQPVGAKLAFAEATLREFDVRNADGSLLSCHAINEYWRGPRDRRGKKRVQP
jgi:hypothetical protein